MEPSAGSIDFVSIFRIALLTAIPLALLIIIISNIAKARAIDMSYKTDPMELSILEESMKRIAKGKLATRDEIPVESEKEELTPEEIRDKLEAERKEFDEFELVDPLIDLETLESEDDSMEIRDDN